MESKHSVSSWPCALEHLRGWREIFYILPSSRQIKKFGGQVHSTTTVISGIFYHVNFLTPDARNMYCAEGSRLPGARRAGGEQKKHHRSRTKETPSLKNGNIMWINHLNFPEQALSTSWPTMPPMLAQIGFSTPRAPRARRRITSLEDKPRPNDDLKGAYFPHEAEFGGGDIYCKRRDKFVCVCGGGCCIYFNSDGKDTPPLALVSVRAWLGLSYNRVCLIFCRSSTFVLSQVLFRGSGLCTRNTRSKYCHSL